MRQRYSRSGTRAIATLAIMAVATVHTLAHAIPPTIGIFDGHGNPIAAPTAPVAPVAVPDLKTLRRQMKELRQSPDADIAAAAEHQLDMLDIAEAKTKGERHAKIAKLGVIITKSAATDGRSGQLVSFSARGKVRIRVYVPPPAAIPDDEPVVRGPSVQEQCYDGPPPCVTEAEMYDLLSVIAQQQANVDAAQQDFDREYAEYQNYCAADPWQCGEPFQEPILTRGPSVRDCGYEGCMLYAYSAVAGLGTAAYGLLNTYWMASPALGAGALTAGAAAGLYAGAIGLGALGVYAGYHFVQCKRQQVRAPFEAYTPIEGY